jgi:hypothetical protein
MCRIFARLTSELHAFAHAELLESGAQMALTVRSVMPIT